MTAIVLYSLTGVLLAVSFIKNKQKTKRALLKALKTLENILPQFLAIIMLIGILLAIINAEFIGKFIGDSSGWWGVVLAASLGSITLMPGFIAFPMSVMILANGAGYMQIAAFVSSLMMVGIITLPMEIKFFNKKSAIIRNVTAFLFSFLVALIIGFVMKV